MHIVLEHGEEIRVTIAGVTGMNFLIATYDGQVTVDYSATSENKASEILCVDHPDEDTETPRFDPSEEDPSGEASWDEEPAQLAPIPNPPNTHRSQIDEARGRLEVMSKKDFRKTWNDHPWFALRHVFKEETAEWKSGEMHGSYCVACNLLKSAMEDRGYTEVTMFDMDHGSDASGPRYTRIALAFDQNDVLTYFYYD